MMDFENLDRINRELEGLMKGRRKTANEHLPETEQTTIDNRTDAEKLRDQVWDEYFYLRKNKMCSRCGKYHRYDIAERKIPTSQDLNDRYGYDFHLIEYKLEKKSVVNKNSNDSEWGNLCNKCKAHVTGVTPNPLGASLLEVERELRELKEKENIRRMFQSDAIREASNKLRKDTENIANETNTDNDKPKNNHKRIRRPRVGVTTNPNDVEKEA
jgi:hypothetical protein